MAESATEQVILMFSGGRDSTLAALRLHRAGHSLKLVTITADHLFGINNVEQRLRELASLLPPDTEWLQIPQPALRGTQHFFHKQTCLPCQSAYVVTGVNIARQTGIRNIALGYAGYQGGWPEQGPQATRILESTLKQHGLELKLPVYDIESRASAVQELKTNGISEMALEQKCIRQVNNVELEGATLFSQLELWGKAIDEELSKSRLLLNISKRVRLGDLV
ncbi:hypothetical protein DW355_02500 [Hylemonella gracilis]|uniref:7-cyano-7-deazaguanine synthase n=1 Tax=Hylemonella gracilis TaxID=80880 RepID=A0A4P6UFH1_9BURK|nr:hypothetical protein [Hylemonella gracilis]QBK03792.1 hypothetical protein DW355_02500 [Hylemonella gracilis]